MLTETGVGEIESECAKKEHKEYGERSHGADCIILVIALASASFLKIKELFYYHWYHLTPLSPSNTLDAITPILLMMISLF